MKKKTTIRDLYCFSWFCYVFVMILDIVIGVYIITGYAELIDNAYEMNFNEWCENPWSDAKLFDSMVKSNKFRL